MSFDSSSSTSPSLYRLTGPESVPCSSDIVTIGYLVAVKFVRSEALPRPRTRFLELRLPHGCISDVAA